MPDSEAQQSMLNEPLARDRVRKRTLGGKEIEYVDGFYAIERANAVFGHGGWSYEIRDRSVLVDFTKGGPNGDRVLVYAMTIRVHALGVFRDGVGVGHADMGGQLAMGVDKAVKEAETDGLKRALRSFGYSFGLALYDVSRDHVGLSEDAAAMATTIETCEPLQLAPWWQSTEEQRKRLPKEDAIAVRALFEKRLQEERMAGRVPLPTKGAPSPATVTPRPQAPTGQLPAPAAPPAAPQLPAPAAPQSAPAAPANAAAQPAEPAPPDDSEARFAGYRDALLVEIKTATTGERLMSIGGTLATASARVREAVHPAYVAKWAAVFATYKDAASRNKAASKIGTLPENVRKTGDWSAVAAFAPTADSGEGTKRA